MARFPRNETSAVLLLACGLLVNCGQKASVDAQAAAKPAAEAPRAISCLGKIVPGEGTRRIAALPQAIIAELKAERGSRTKRGDVLAVLQDYASAMAAQREAEQQVAVAESALAQVKAPDKQASIAAQEAILARQKFVASNLATEFERRKLLFAEKIIAAMEVENAEARYKGALEDVHREEGVLAGLQQVREVDINVARKKLSAAEATRDRAAAEAERNLVRAPMNGTVLEIFARPGEIVTADRGVLDLGDTSTMFVEAEVYAADFPRVKRGARATITGEAFSGELQGAVDEILREAGESRLFPPDPATAADKRVVRVRIRLTQGQPVERLSGLQVAVRIEP